MNKLIVWIKTMSSKNVAFASIIVIFMILLLQSALSLFFGASSEGMEQIDIVFRTSLSSIFGYLMSVISVNSSANKKNNIVATMEKPKTIGFTAENTNNSDNPNASFIWANENSEPTINQAKIQEVTTQTTNIQTPKKVMVNYQIAILAAVCIFCLFIMLIVRNFSEFIIPDTSTAVTLSVYRDFVSASIGALIGLAKG